MGDMEWYLGSVEQKLRDCQRKLDKAKSCWRRIENAPKAWFDGRWCNLACKDNLGIRRLYIAAQWKKSTIKKWVRPSPKMKEVILEVDNSHWTDDYGHEVICRNITHIMPIEPPEEE